MTFATYDSWLEAPRTNGGSLDVDDAYAAYVADHRAASDREFADGGHDYTNPDDFYAAGEQPLSYEDFALRWFDEQEANDEYRRIEARYPDARI